MNHRHGDQDSLCLADTHLCRILTQEIVVRGQADTFQRFSNRGIAIGGRSGGVGTPGFSQLGPNLQGWIQRGEWALQYQGNLPPA